MQSDAGSVLGSPRRMVNCGEGQSSVPVRSMSCSAKRKKGLKLCAGGFSLLPPCCPGLCEGRPGGGGMLPGSISQPCLPAADPGPTCILPHLYLGSQADVLDKGLMSHNGITHVLNASNTCPRPDFVPESCFLRVPVNDSYCEKILPWLDRSVDFIEQVKVSDSRVLVHCLAGISRSATVAIAYVMKSLGLGSDEAYRFVKEKRPSISPNFNFLGQLLEYEKLLRAQKGIPPAPKKPNSEAPIPEPMTEPASERTRPSTSPAAAEGSLATQSLQQCISRLRLSPERHGHHDCNRLKRSLSLNLRPSDGARAAARSRGAACSVRSPTHTEESSKVCRLEAPAAAPARPSAAAAASSATAAKTTLATTGPKADGGGGEDGGADPLGSPGEKLKAQLWLNLSGSTQTMVGEKFWSRRSDFAQPQPPASTPVPAFGATWYFPDAAPLNGGEGGGGGGGGGAGSGGGGGICGTHADVRLRVGARPRAGDSGGGGESLAAVEGPRRSWHEELGSAAEKAAFKRRSCQLEFEEGLAAESRSRENIAAIAKRSSFSGSMEIIEVS
ncbi:dual specificity protein phosphatase 8-like isoform X1 [Lampetra planeri]